MTRWAVLTGLLLLAAPHLGQAREEKADDLALVPGSARLVVSTRPSELWASDLGKEARKELGREADEWVKEVKEALGVGPEAVERATVFALAQGDGMALACRIRGKFDARKFLNAVVPGAESKKVGGREMHVRAGVAAHVNGNVVLFGAEEAVKAGLTGEERSRALTEALKRIASGKHAVVAYADSRLFPGRDDRPKGRRGPEEFFGPLLRAEEAVAWADIGAELKVSGRISFPDAASAEGGEQALSSLRKRAVAALAEVQRAFEGRKELAQAVAGLKDGLAETAVKRVRARIDISASAKADHSALVALGKEALEAAREAEVRARSANNLKQIGRALHSYHDTFKSFPGQAIRSKARRPLLSWRVAILPYIGEEELYRRFKLDQPWDSPHNKKLIPLMPKLYAPVTGKGAEEYGTPYQAVYGPRCAFEGQYGLPIGAFPDGLSNTIMVVEAGKEVVWTRPTDVLGVVGIKAKLATTYRSGFNVLMGDGSVHFLSKKISPKTLRALVTRNGFDIPGSDF